ncbi:hypothetical protein B0H14DRAFT_2765234 [Mycena olivaceomarginata]|nr:hypothetical protein B0H14DRAFT_2765234 [Mycena olivaceomarginata]
MLLASAYAEVDTDGSGGLRFVIQDRPVIVEMGEKAWRAKCRELLDSCAVRFHGPQLLHPAPGHRRCGLPPPCRAARLARCFCALHPPLPPRSRRAAHQACPRELCAPPRVRG